MRIVRIGGAIALMGVMRKVRKLDAFGMARRAARIHLHDRVFRRTAIARVDSALLGKPVFVSLSAFGRAVRDDHVPEMFQFTARRIEKAHKRLADEDDLCARIVEDVGDLGRRQTPVHGHKHGADLGRTEQDLEIAVGILIHRGDAIAGLGAKRFQPVGHTRAALVENLVGRGAVAVDQRNRIGTGLGVIARHVGQRFNLGHIRHVCPPDCRRSIPRRSDTDSLSSALRVERPQPACLSGFKRFSVRKAGRGRAACPCRCAFRWC